jgi:hypothetical protein
MPIFLQLNMVPIHAIKHSSYLSSWFDYIHTLLNRYDILLFIDSCSGREGVCMVGSVPLSGNLVMI